MSESTTIATFMTRLAGLSEAEALELVRDAVLLQSSYELSEHQRGFHTAYIERVPQGPGSVAPHKREVFAIRKRGNAVFGGHIAVGRTPNLDIVIARAGVSKFHAFFSRDDRGQQHITDKESKNGTFVAGKRLTPGVATLVQDGDEIRFGGHAFVYMEPLSFVQFVDARARWT